MKLKLDTDDQVMITIALRSFVKELDHARHNLSSAEWAQEVRRDYLNQRTDYANLLQRLDIEAGRRPTYGPGY